MKKILIIDDSPNNIMLLSEMLEEKGYEVISAVNPEQGILVFDNNPDLHAVVSDYDMQEKKTGAVVIREIKAKNPNMLCVLMSMADPPDKASDVGAIFICRFKSNAEELLLEALEQM
ncbi:MAG: hypothetical protein A3C06_00425 [Candidatus Taylorbacteria bacterium RIFCSPHIGHO2_02_FULL_46_13]|uniref:Response regulatory domain-containing protein n=1 Tax=Candidatus Taylorbacteria bacterium RIFCSPHIGHO2_02_FULL_46_13 TaxID=1802312 RepID=A0A1G2MPU7_9BACT|nr:MAG: hypothetical protein A3C06_00425 [Candidatus Taylorbacteria bacterium RIFCSPHIGHO2_02_FULL_46_13]